MRRLDFLVIVIVANISYDTDEEGSSNTHYDLTCPFFPLPFRKLALGGNLLTFLLMQLLIQGLLLSVCTRCRSNPVMIAYYRASGCSAAW